jgi:hypothetical protein
MMIGSVPLVTLLVLSTAVWGASENGQGSACGMTSVEQAARSTATGKVHRIGPSNVSHAQPRAARGVAGSRGCVIARSVGCCVELGSILLRGRIVVSALRAPGPNAKLDGSQPKESKAAQKDGRLHRIHWPSSGAVATQPIPRETRQKGLQEWERGEADEREPKDDHAPCRNVVPRVPRLIKSREGYEDGAEHQKASCDRHGPN